MILPDLLSVEGLGLAFVIIFFVLMLIFAAAGRKRPTSIFRPIPAFNRLVRALGLAVEAGQRLHVSLGWGGIFGLRGGSALVGLSVLNRMARIAAISDRPPVATSGEGTTALLSQETISASQRFLGEQVGLTPAAGQLTGVTPFSYAVGTFPLIRNQQVSANFLAGHFGVEAALITDAAERNGSLSLGGSDNLSGQAVLFASAIEPLIGEELYASSAYLQAGNLHVASLRAQDAFRWIVVLAIIAGAVLKFLGVL